MSPWVRVLTAQARRPGTETPTPTEEGRHGHTFVWSHSNVGALRTGGPLRLAGKGVRKRAI